MGKKIYAIKEGFDKVNNKKIKNEIVDTWDECLGYVKGVKGAKYKSFTSVEAAKEYLFEGPSLLKKGVDEYPTDCLHLYVDGSYNLSTQKYSYGVVAVRNDVVEYIESDSCESYGERNIRQIAGELKAAIKSIEYALKLGEKKVVLFHDYEGIFHHAVGTWERKESSSQNYYQKMNELFAKGIEVVFVKVDSHTGDLYNELADEKCKEALGIESEGIVGKWLKKNSIYVANHFVKNQICGLNPFYDIANIKIYGEQEDEKNSIHLALPLRCGKTYCLNVDLEIMKIIKGLNEEKKLEALEYIKNLAKE